VHAGGRGGEDWAGRGVRVCALGGNTEAVAQPIDAGLSTGSSASLRQARSAAKLVLM